MRVTDPSIAAQVRVLVVDDEAPHLRALVHILELEGYRASGVQHPAEALQKLQAEQFDILLTDLMMPDMDGLALLRAAHRLDPHLVGVMMTGHGTIDTAVEAMKNGALDYILKPFTMTTMLPVMARAISVRRLRLENAVLQERLAERNAELEKSNQELRSLNRGLDAFTRAVSHDVRQPLNGMIGFADFLLSEKPGPLNDKQKEYLGDILRGGQRLAELAEDLLRFASLGHKPINREPVDVAGLVAAVVAELLAAQPGRQVELRIGALPGVLADRALLRQVFVNLIGNAFKFTRNCAQPVVEIDGRVAGETCEYSVRDNGVGFDMQQAGPLFRIFQRMRGAEQFEGTGVGLSIVLDIVERHGGHITAKAQPGSGAEFTFSLPR